jgi:hypothetical protein
MDAAITARRAWVRRSPAGAALLRPAAAAFHVVFSE